MTILRTAGLAGTTDRSIPDATVSRLPLYLRALTHLLEQGVVTCSSDQLASSSGVNSANVRKDLSFLGSYGTRGVGYDVENLHDQISEAIGQTRDWDVVIVGAGHLGSALAAYEGFGQRGIRIAAIVDVDPARTGLTLGGVKVAPAAELADIVVVHDITIGIIATPPEAAQVVADSLVAAGVTSILNFAPTSIRVPEGTDVRQVDLAAELQILAYHELRKMNVEDEALPAGAAS